MHKVEIPVFLATSTCDRFSRSLKIRRRFSNESFHNSGNTRLPSGTVMTCTHSVISGQAGGFDIEGRSTGCSDNLGRSLTAVSRMFFSSFSIGVSMCGGSTDEPSLRRPFNQSLLTPIVMPDLMDLFLRPSLVVGSCMRSDLLKISSAFS